MRLFAAAALAFLAAGCATTFQTTDQVQQKLRERYLGANAEYFFRQHGMPASTMPRSGGGNLYEWRSSRTTQAPSNTSVQSYWSGNMWQTNATTTGGNVRVRSCVLSLTTSTDGSITSIDVVADDFGGYSMSTCAGTLSLP